MNRSFNLFVTRLSHGQLAGVCLGAAVGLAGCVNMSGLDANSNYSCPAPPGVVCKPMSEVYRSRTPVPSESVTAKDASAEAKPRETSEDIQRLNSTLPAAPFVIGGYQPLRSKPKILSIWVAPFEDSDGDLHEEHKMYLQVDSGHWMIEHHVEEIRNAFAPLHAPSTAKGPPDSPADKSAKQPDKSPTGYTGTPRPSTEQPDAFDSAAGSGVPK